MTIVFMNRTEKDVFLLRLNDAEARKYNEAARNAAEDLESFDDFDIVCEIAKGHGINVGLFDPVYYVSENDKFEAYEV